MIKKVFIERIDELIKSGLKISKDFKKYYNDDPSIKFYALDKIYEGWKNSVRRCFEAFFSPNKAIKYYEDITLKDDKQDIDSLLIIMTRLRDIQNEVKKGLISRTDISKSDFIKNILACSALPSLGYIFFKEFFPNLVLGYQLNILLLTLLFLSILLYFPSIKGLIKKFIVAITILGPIVLLIKNIKDLIKSWK